MAWNNTHSADLEAGSSQLFTAADSASLSITGDMTVEGWFKFESLTGDPVLLSKEESAGNQRSFYCQFLSSNALRMGISIDGITYNIGTDTPWTPSANVWYHIAFVYDAAASSYEVFINGTGLGTKTGLNTAMFNSTAVFRIGAVAAPFDGLVDDVRVWNIKRTGTQINDNKANFDLSGSSTNLQAYWKLDNALTDSTANANTLTNVGGAVFVTETVSATSTSAESLGTPVEVATVTTAVSVSVSDVFGTPIERGLAGYGFVNGTKTSPTFVNTTKS